MARIHLKDYDGKYLCFPIIKSNPNKLTTSIKECNCAECLKIVAENGFSIPFENHKENVNQTSLTAFI